jgi:hypothetical protein
MTERIVDAKPIPGTNRRGDSFEVVIREVEDAPRFRIGVYVVGDGPLSIRLYSGESLALTEDLARSEANHLWTLWRERLIP